MADPLVQPTFRIYIELLSGSSRLALRANLQRLDLVLPRPTQVRVAVLESLWSLHGVNNTQSHCFHALGLLVCVSPAMRCQNIPIYVAILDTLILSPFPLTFHHLLIFASSFIASLDLSSNIKRLNPTDLKLKSLVSRCGVIESSCVVSRLVSSLSLIPPPHFRVERFSGSTIAAKRNNRRQLRPKARSFATLARVYFASPRSCRARCEKWIWTGARWAPGLAGQCQAWDMIASRSESVLIRLLPRDARRPNYLQSGLDCC